VILILLSQGSSILNKDPGTGWKSRSGWYISMLLNCGFPPNFYVDQNVWPTGIFEVFLEMPFLSLCTKQVILSWFSPFPIKLQEASRHRQLLGHEHYVLRFLFKSTST
jgi:hypothetical protein